MTGSSDFYNFLLWTESCSKLNQVKNITFMVCAAAASFVYLSRSCWDKKSAGNTGPDASQCVEWNQIGQNWACLPFFISTQMVWRRHLTFHIAISSFSSTSSLDLLWAILTHPHSNVIPLPHFHPHWPIGYYYRDGEMRGVHFRW